MDETIFPPSPTWFLPKILVTREDGSVAYGTKNNIVILKTSENTFETVIIKNAHEFRITSVAFSPPMCDESVQDCIVSCAEDGFFKLWKIDTLSAIMGHKSHSDVKNVSGRVVSLDWSVANPRHIISAAENTLVLWDVLSNTTQKFTFQKLGATVIACCPYNEKIVAVGSKSGLIFIISISHHCNIVYKLRGHDNEINSLSWCPIPYNIFNENDLYEEFLLASGCQDKEIFIWRAGSDGKCELKLGVPTTPVSKQESDSFHAKFGHSFSFLALFWFDPYTIYLSSNFGELLSFDIKSYLMSKPVAVSNSVKKINKQALNCFKVVHFLHGKGLFAIAGTPKKAELIRYEPVEVKSELKFKIESNDIKMSETLTSNQEEEHPKWGLALPNKSSLIWTAGQDRKIIACKLVASQVEIVFKIHTMNGFVYGAVVSPHDPNRIAVAVGDGMIRLWNLTEPSGNIQIYWQKIKDRVMCLAWHPIKDGILAYATSEGRVGVIDTNATKLPNVFKPGRPLPVYNLSWGPEFVSNPPKNETKSEFSLYAVGDNTLWVYSYSNQKADPINLSKILQFACKKQTDVSWKPDYSIMAVGSEDGSISLVEPTEFKIVYTLFAYKKLIESIAWHPSSTSLDSGVSPYHGYFTSGSTDNENDIRIFNCTVNDKKAVVEKVATLKGHHGHVQSTSWCPHVSGRLISTSADGSVQIWDVISQIPLANFTPIGMPLFSIWSPVDPDLIITGCRSSVLCVWKISSQTKTAPCSQKKAKKHKIKGSELGMAEEIAEEFSKVAENPTENRVLTEGMAEEKNTNTNSKEKELKIFSKVWKLEEKDQLKACYLLLKGEQKDNLYSLPFLGDYDIYAELVKAEEKCRKSTSSTEYCDLTLWSGNMKETIEKKIKNGQLSDFLVSLAPAVSPRVWKEACLAYSKILVENKLFRKAATYLVVCHQIYEAIQLLTDANLYLEALCIAKSRLPQSDPMIPEVVKQYAQWLFKNGAFMKACECYIYLNEYLEVANICGKKSQPEYLSLAALAARKAESKDLETSEATNAILKCFEMHNFKLAKLICDDHCDLKYLRLMYNTHHTVHLLDVGSLILKKDILTHIKESSDVENVILPNLFDQLYHKYVLYKSKQRMYLVVGQQLVFANLVDDKEKILTHLIRALSTCCRFTHNVKNEVHPLYKVCNWLSPLGCLSENSYFTLKEDDLIPKVKSLRAFLCAAIIRNLNDNPVPEDIIQRLDVLSELKDDLLDKDSYEYYKNLIEVELCEKRVMKNRSKLNRMKLSDTCHKNSTQVDDLHNTDPQTSLMVENGKVNGFEAIESIDEIQTNRSNDLENSEVLKTVGQGCLKEGGLPSVHCLNQSESKEFELDENLEERIHQDTELLSNLKVKIDSFESSRVSTPNPVPVYFMLKKLCEAIPENESAKVLLQDIENIWEGLT